MHPARCQDFGDGALARIEALELGVALNDRVRFFGDIDRHKREAAALASTDPLDDNAVRYCIGRPVGHDADNLHASLQAVAGQLQAHPRLVDCN